MEGARRPLSLLVAVTVLAVVGIGCLFAAPVLALQAPLAAQLDDHLGAMASAFLWLAGVACAAAGVAGLAAALGTWRGRAWGWLLGLVVSGVVLLGTVVAMGSSGALLPLVAGAVIGGIGLVALLAPATRRVCAV